MAADALAPGIARLYAAMVLTMQIKWNLVFNEEGFQLPALSHCPEIIEDANIFQCFIKYI